MILSLFDNDFVLEQEAKVGFPPARLIEIIASWEALPHAGLHADAPVCSTATGKCPAKTRFLINFISHNCPPHFSVYVLHH